MRRFNPDILIVYFSHEGEAFWDGGIRTLEQGNTKRVAEIIAKSLNGVLLRIQPVASYPHDYYECLEAAKREQQQDALPEIRTFRGEYPPLEFDITDFGNYRLVFLGFPIWWGQAPQCILTFLDGIKSDGAFILPFCTHEGTGFGSSVQRLKNRYPNTSFGTGLAIQGSKVDRSRAQIEAWAKMFYTQ